MRHRVQRSRLSLSFSPRKALLIALSRALLINGKIITTKERAKNARRLAEQLITLGKDGSLSAKRRAYAILKEHQLVSKLFNDIAPKFKSRSGGYTRIMRLNNRKGDGAEMVLFELTEKIKEEKSFTVEKKVKAKDKPQDAEEKLKPVEQDVELKKSKKVDQPKDDNLKAEAVKEKKTQVASEAEEKKSAKFMGGLRRFFKKEKDKL